MIDIIWWYFC